MPHALRAVLSSLGDRQEFRRGVAYRLADADGVSLQHPKHFGFEYRSGPHFYTVFVWRSTFPDSFVTALLAALGGA